MRDREDLPIDDFTINDDELFMGDLVPGLIITHCEGRETLPLEVNTTDYRFNGSVVNYTRYPSRELVFDFDLFTEDNDWFREATNVLNEQLNRDYCEIRFNDDGEHFYRGYFTMGEVERYANHLQGQFKFICIDPFRYSDEVTKVNGVYDSDNSCTLSPHYGEFESGAVPTKPVLHVQFDPNASGDITTDGDCGYVAFMTSDGDILQVGDPSAVSSQTSTGTFAFCNKTSLTTLDGVEYPLPDKYATHHPVAGTITPNKSWKDTYYNKGAGKTFYCYDYLGFDSTNYPGGPG